MLLWVSTFLSGKFYVGYSVGISLDHRGFVVLKHANEKRLVTDEGCFETKMSYHRKSSYFS